MQLAFYICSIIAILATLRIITHTNPVHALLHLIISLLATSGVFFTIGGYFVAAVEIIIYAGAIMVLFVFMIMMMNLGSAGIKQERQWLKLRIWISSGMLSLIILMLILYTIMGINDHGINSTPIIAKSLGMKLFGGPYMLAVELVSMLLLAGLIVVFHIGRKNYLNEALVIHEDKSKQRKMEELE